MSALAARQHGVVSRQQLIAAGVTRAAIEHRLRVRRLHRIYAGVYAVGHPLLRPHARYMAAVLSYGDGTLLSHTSAASLWGIRPTSSARIELTVTRRAASRQDIKIHEARAIHPAEVTTENGVPCTSVARTLLDLAAAIRPRELRRAIERSEELRLFDGRDLDAALIRANGRRGVRALRRILAEFPAELPPIRSELERRFLELVRDAGLPMPVVNARVCGHEVDFHWPARHLVVETDGRSTHDSRHAFERDRARDLDLQLAGSQVVRLTWSQVTCEPPRVQAMLRVLLECG